MSNLCSGVNKIGSSMWNLFLSTTGCFVFTRGYGLVSIGERGPVALAPSRASIKPWTTFAEVDSAG